MPTYLCCLFPIPTGVDIIGMKEQGLAQVRVEVLSVGDGSYKRKKRGFFW
jgi:hypothetical protein